MCLCARRGLCQLVAPIKALLSQRMMGDKDQSGGPSQRNPSSFIFLSLSLSFHAPRSLNPPNGHSKWLSWSKFITATSADNQMLSLDSHRLSLWPLRAEWREGRGGREGVIGGKGGLRGGEAGVANLTVPDRWEVVRSVLSPPPPPLHLPHIIIPHALSSLLSFSLQWFSSSFTIFPLPPCLNCPPLFLHPHFYLFPCLTCPCFPLFPPFAASPCVGWPMSRPLSLALV